MSLEFDTAYTQTLYMTSPPVTVPPFTLSIWFRDSVAAVSYGTFSIGHSADDHHHSLALYRSPNRVGVITQRDADWQNYANSTTNFSAETWHHACGVVVSTANRSIYLDGGGKATSTSNCTNPNVNSVRIGRRADQYGVAFDGRLAHAVIYDAELNDEEIATLALGISPFKIRPQSLVFYAPLIRDYRDLISGITLTEAGTGSPTVAPHPRMFNTRRRG